VAPLITFFKSFLQEDRSFILKEELCRYRNPEEVNTENTRRQKNYTKKISKTTKRNLWKNKEQKRRKLKLL